MKATLYILATVSIIGIVVACTSPPKTSTKEVVILMDVTDKQLAKPDVNGILALFDFSGDNTWNGGVFRFSNLSDVSYNRYSEAKINTAGMWFSNELERGKEIKKFQKEVSKILSEAGNVTEGKNNSSIYFPIAHELNTLAKSKAQRRVLIVYSDLMENTIDISFYNKKQFRMITSNPELMRENFEQMQTLQNLNGIEVYLIYQPTDSESDKIFTAVSTFYKKLLEDNGAKVTISANINL